MKLPLSNRQTAEQKLQRRIDEAAANVAAVVSTLIDQKEEPPFRVGIGRNPFKWNGHRETEQYVDAVWSGALSLLADLSVAGQVQLDTKETKSANQRAVRDGSFIRLGVTSDLTLIIAPPQD